MTRKLLEYTKSLATRGTPKTVVGVGAAGQGVGRGSKGRLVVIAVRAGDAVTLVRQVPLKDVAATWPDCVGHLVLDARLSPNVRDALGELVEQVTVVHPETEAPLGEAKELSSWRTQAALGFRELLRDGLVLPRIPALRDQLSNLRTIEGPRGVLTAVPRVLPLADAVLLTLHPLLRKARGYPLWFSGMGDRSFSHRRAERLARLLGGADGITALRGGRAMTDGTWDALTGGSRSSSRGEGGCGSPFDRGGGGGGSPFERRYEE